MEVLGSFGGGCLEFVNPYKWEEKQGSNLQVKGTVSIYSIILFYDLAVWQLKDSGENKIRSHNTICCVVWDLKHLLQSVKSFVDSGHLHVI